MPVETNAVAAIVARQLGCGSVRQEDRLVEDLGAESMDIVNIVATLEERYRLQIDEAELPEIRTVADLADRAARGSGRP